MSWNEYLKIVCELFPKRNYDILFEQRSCNRIDIVNYVAKDLFLIKECDTELACVTREKILSLEKTGIMVW